MSDSASQSAILPELTAVLYVLRDVLEDIWGVDFAVADKRRMLVIAKKLQSHARAQNASYKSSTANSVKGFLKVMESFISEADMCYRFPYEDNRAWIKKGREHMKPILYEMRQCWKDLSVLAPK